MLERKFKLLFLCTGNQARSQMAEALLRSKAGERFDVYSAGSKPGDQVHPMAVSVLGELGIDISAARPKSLMEFVNENFDYVITLCDNAGDTCPMFPGQPVSAHWSFEDPVAFEGSEEEKLGFFRQIRDQIAKQLDSFIKE